MTTTPTVTRKTATATPSNTTSKDRNRYAGKRDGHAEQHHQGKRDGDAEQHHQGKRDGDAERNHRNAGLPGARPPEQK